MIKKEYQREWRKKHPDFSKAYNKKWREKNRERERTRTALARKRTRDFKMNYKKDKCCSICGWKEHPEVMHFHHVKGDKSFDVSDQNQYSNEKLRQEIEKCILICPNCHAWIHFPKGNNTGGCAK